MRKFLPIERKVLDLFGEQGFPTDDLIVNRTRQRKRRALAQGAIAGWIFAGLGSIATLLGSFFVPPVLSAMAILVFVFLISHLYWVARDYYHPLPDDSQNDPP